MSAVDKLIEADQKRAREADRLVRQEAVRELVERSCAEQGVPVKITDPTVLRRVAALLGVPR